MSVVQIPKLGDFFGRDLAGWKIGYCYLLELDHQLMRNFPAITVEGKEVVAVTERRLLKLIWNQLEKRKAKVTQLLAIADISQGLAFNLEGTGDKSQMEPMRLFGGAEIYFACKRPNYFQWAPGLANGNSSPVREPIFE